MTSKASVSMLAALAALTFAASAQAQRSPVSLEGRIGAVVPTGDWGQLAKTGVGGSASITFHATPVVGIYGGYTYNRFDLDNDLGSDGNWTEQGFDAGVQASFTTPGSMVSPYFRGGVIFHKLGASSSLGDASGDYKAGFEVSGGVALRVAPQVSITPAVGYSEFDPGDSSGGSSNVNISNVKLSVGVSFHP